MLKPSYIILSGVNVGFSTLTSLMVIKFFGATESADVYMMCIAIVATLQLLQLLMVDQFLYFYLEKKREGQLEARSFFTTVFSQSLVAGLLFSYLCYSSTDVILTFFASGLEIERKQKLLQILNILIWSCTVFTANFVMHRLLNAEGRFAYPYWLEIIVPVSCLLAFGIFFVTGVESLLLLVYARLAGAGLSFMLGFCALRRFGLFTKIEWMSTSGLACYRNSFSMRFGHNLHGFLFSPITNSFLSTLPVGSAAIYYYSERFVQLVNVIISGPLQRVYQVRMSTAWLEGSLKSVFVLMKTYSMLVATLFTSTAMALYFFIPYILEFRMFSGLSVGNIETLKTLFAFLALWVGIVAVEHAFVVVGLVTKKSGLFIAVNLLFILGYATLCSVLQGQYGLLAIPLAAISAQVISFALFFVFILKMIKDRKNRATTAGDVRVD